MERDRREYTEGNRQKGAGKEEEKDRRDRREQTEEATEVKRQKGETYDE
jgi:hypothetical protein